MKTCKPIFPIFLFILSSYFHLSIAQSNNSQKQQINNNAFLFNFGNGFFIHGASVYYEHIFMTKKYQRSIAPIVKIGGGISSDYVLSEMFLYEQSETTQFITSQIGFITSVSKKHHFEMCGGIAHYTYNDDYEDNTNISLSIGYRYQKPNNHFFLRTGISYPEFLHLGIGYSF